MKASNMFKILKPCAHCCVRPGSVQNNCVLGEGIRFKVTCEICRRSPGWSKDKESAIRDWNEHV